MMTARKRVGPLPIQQLAVRHSVNHSSSDYFSLDDAAQDSYLDSSSEASLDFHSDASSDSSSRHSLPDHSSPDLLSTSAGPSSKRYVEVDPRGTSLRDDAIVKGSDEPYLEKDIDPEIQAEIDARVVVEAVDREESETGTRGLVKVTYETLGDLVQRFHDHTEAIPLHHVQVIKGVQREHGCRIIGVESAVTALTERIAELERDNKRLRGTARVEKLADLRRVLGSTWATILRYVHWKMPNTRSGASMTHDEVEELVTHRVAKEIEAREAAMNLEPLNENGNEGNGGNRGNRNGGNRGNRNGGNRGNGNGGNGGNGNEGNEGNGNGGNGENGNGNRNGNHGMNYGGFMPVARECTFQDFLKCKLQNFSGTKGVVGLTRWFEKIETVFNISNCPPKYQVKYATYILQEWWNSHKRTIGVDAAYAMNWAGLMRLMT
ncbi:hypothetical protein Tco_0994912, partial [Tanacetum coccineum]